MLRTGAEHLESLRDGRVVYVGSERVDDVTRHPAFRGAAATVAAIYDMKADPANRDTLSYEEDGVVIAGMKMLATGALYANEIWIGNVIPLAPDQKKEAITCAVPCNAPGLSLWSRKPAVLSATSGFDSPLAWRYDESDSMVLCDSVKVPWEKVFVHDDAVLSRDIYIKTPSHCFGNHQSNVRYWSKMRLLLGLCSKIAQATGADQVPAVRETLGKMAAVESTIGGLVHGPINACERWSAGYLCFYRRFMYAGLDWCTQNYSRFVDELRELCGGSVFQMPADISVLDDRQPAKQFSTYWQTPQADAVTRLKLFQLAWDMVGSEFAGRPLQYEKVY